MNEFNDDNAIADGYIELVLGFIIPSQLQMTLRITSSQMSKKSDF